MIQDSWWTTVSIGVIYRNIDNSKEVILPGSHLSDLWAALVMRSPKCQTAFSLKHKPGESGFHTKTYEPQQITHSLSGMLAGPVSWGCHVGNQLLWFEITMVPFNQEETATQCASSQSQQKILQGAKGILFSLITTLEGKIQPQECPTCSKHS